MKTKFENIEDENWVIDSFNRILVGCSSELRETIITTQLIIIDELTANKQFENDPHFNTIQKTYKIGFGGQISNFLFENINSHFVILNMQLIKQLTLTEDELDGVLSHELGHIFNANTPKSLPLFTLENTNYFVEKNAIALENLQNNEFYADHFSKMTKNVSGLISSFEKYTNSSYCDEKGLFTFRIQKLNSMEVFKGIIRHLNTNVN